MSKKIEATIEALITQPILDAGFELADVEYKKEDDEWVLTAYICSDNGILIDDCELVSRLIEPIIDEADPIEEQYMLSVSSFGLDRALKKLRDFQRNIGKTIITRLYAQVDGVKEYKGVLLECNDKFIKIKTLDPKKNNKTKNFVSQEKTLEYSEFASAKLFVDFNDF